MRVTDFLSSIENKRKLYLGEGDLSALKYFLDGFCVCAQVHGIEYGEEDMRAFSDFVCSAYCETRSVSLFQCISEHTHSDEEAFERFYELLHRFFDVP